MILEILTYTHNITTMLFGIFLSAFFLGVKKDKTNVGKLLLLAVTGVQTCALPICDFRGLIYGLRICAGSGDGGSDIPTDRSRAAIADAGALL